MLEILSAIIKSMILTLLGDSVQLWIPLLRKCRRNGKGAEKGTEQDKRLQEEIRIRWSNIQLW